MKTFSIVLAFSAGLHSQQIAGKVVNSLNGEPIRKAFVLAKAEDATNGMNYSAETDAHGSFSIAGVEPGSYSITAQHTGFTFQVAGASGAPPVPLKLEPGQPIQGLVLRLVPQGVITGRVLDEEGDPIQYAEVLIAQSISAGDYSRRANSNSNGEYRLFYVDPGTYYIRVILDRQPSSKPDDSLRGARIPQAPVFTYFPGVADPGRAVPIKVKPGAQLSGFDIRVRREKLYTIRIKVPERSGAHFYDVYFRSGAEVRDVESYEEGNTIAMPAVAPGAYLVVVEQRTGEKRSYARLPAEVVDSDIEITASAFSPGVNVTGAVVAEDKKPHPWQNIEVGLTSDVNDSFERSPKKDGTFNLEDVPPDTYHLTFSFIERLPGLYLKSIRMGDRELADWQLDLTKPPEPLTVLFGVDGGEIDGAVKNAKGDGVTRARVSLIPYDNQPGQTERTKSTFSGEKGEFNFKDIAPGQYRIFAWEDVDANFPQDPAFRKRFEKQSVPVKIEPNGIQKVELTAISATEARP